MSEEQQVKQYSLGIIAPRSFADVRILEELLIRKLFYIRHIYTNGVVSGGKTVEEFADNHKITKTVYPITPTDGGVFKSNWAIIKYSDFIYIFDDGQSKNVKAVEEECKEQQKKYKIVKYTPETNLSKYEKLINKIEKLALQDSLLLEKTKSCEEIHKLITEFKGKNVENKTISVEN